MLRPLDGLAVHRGANGCFNEERKKERKERRVRKKEGRKEEEEEDDEVVEGEWTEGCGG